MQAILNLIWDKLLPEMKTAALAEDAEAHKKLEQKLKTLSLRTPKGADSTAKFAGKQYDFPTNDRKLEWIKIESNGKDGGVTLVASLNGVERRIACGQDKWLSGKAAWGRFPEQPAAASGAWTGDDAFTAKLCFYETPFILTLRLKFSGEEVRCQTESNVGFGPTKESELVGKAK